MGNKRLTGIFLELLAINSPSKKERKVRNYIVKHLRPLADKLRRDDAGKGFGGNCGNVVALFRGGNRGAPTVVLVAHMDTVTETGKLKIVNKKGVIRSDGTTILGADDKAGIAVMLELAHKLGKPSLRKTLGDVEMLFSPAEEIGLFGVTHLDYSLITGKIAYVLDSSDPVGFVTNSSPSSARIKVRVHGKTAHAGVEPEKGINAIVLASKAIARMRLGRLDDETTANIGVVSGGKATNIVPELATAEGECRSFSEAKLDRQIRHMEKCFVNAAKKGGGKVEVEVKKAFVTYNIDEKEPIMRAAKSAAGQLGIKYKAVRSGGGSDANVLNRQGITSVVLGLGYKAPHTEKERIPINRLETAARYVLWILRENSAEKA